MSLSKNVECIVEEFGELFRLERNGLIPTNVFRQIYYDKRLLDPVLPYKLSSHVRVSCIDGKWTYTFLDKRSE